jgi:hypothetical protein
MPRGHLDTSHDSGPSLTATVGRLGHEWLFLAAYLAEDAIQEAFLKLLQHRRTVRPDACAQKEQREEPTDCCASTHPAVSTCAP